MVAAFALVSGMFAITTESPQAHTEPMPPAWAHEIDAEDLLS